MSKPALRHWPAAKLASASQRVAQDLKRASPASARALKGWQTRYAAMQFRKSQGALL